MSLSDTFRARAVEGHELAVARGEHDDQCEWRADGFYVCNCSPRRRAREGYTTPPGELIYQAPLCPRCLDEVHHDGNSLTCEPCCVHWPDGMHGDAEFFDDHGDLTDDLAKWEAAKSDQGATPAEAVTAP